MPGAAQLYAAAKEANQEARALREQLAALPDVYKNSAQLSSSQRKKIADLRQRLSEVENELYEYRKVEQTALPPPEPSQSQPPRIYKRGEE